jgi:hypothetical protein
MELQMYLQAYLAELLGRYSECEEVVAWLQEKQMQKGDFMAVSIQQMQEGSPSFVRRPCFCSMPHALLSCGFISGC